MTPEAKAEPCDAFNTEIEKIWNDKVLEELELPMRVYDGELDASDGEAILTSVNVFTKKWIEHREKICQDHNLPNSMDNEKYEQIVNCLNDSLEQLKTQLTELKSGERTQMNLPESDLENCY